MLEFSNQIHLIEGRRSLCEAVDMTLLNDVFEAYLNPLLKKHSDGKYLTWEDLEASNDAAKKVLGSSDNLFVSVRCGGAGN